MSPAASRIGASNAAACAAAANPPAQASAPWLSTSTTRDAVSRGQVAGRRDRDRRGGAVRTGHAVRRADQVRGLGHRGVGDRRRPADHHDTLHRRAGEVVPRRRRQRGGLGQQDRPAVGGREPARGQGVGERLRRVGRAVGRERAREDRRVGVRRVGLRPPRRRSPGARHPRGARPRGRGPPAPPPPCRRPRRRRPARSRGSAPGGPRPRATAVGSGPAVGTSSSGERPCSTPDASASANASSRATTSVSTDSGNGVTARTRAASSPLAGASPTPTSAMVSGWTGAAPAGSAVATRIATTPTAHAGVRRVIAVILPGGAASSDLDGHAHDHDLRRAEGRTSRPPAWRCAAPARRGAHARSAMPGISVGVTSS